jgi:predicted GIY-YIG superfamily endonuclease
VVEPSKALKLTAKFPGETVVYLAYGRAKPRSKELLLYVGIADNFYKRMGQHAAKSPWFRFVERFEVEPYETRHKAMVREKYLIRHRHPAHNEQHQDAENLTRIRAFKAQDSEPVCKRCESSPPTQGYDTCGWCRNEMPKIEQNNARRASLQGRHLGGARR